MTVSQTRSIPIRMETALTTVVIPRVSGIRRSARVGLLLFVAGNLSFPALHRVHRGGVAEAKQMVPARRDFPYRNRNSLHMVLLPSIEAAAEDE